MIDEKQTPVTCKYCKRWLAEVGKQSYGDIANLENTNKDDVDPDAANIRRQGRDIPPLAVNVGSGLALPGSPAVHPKQRGSYNKQR